MIGNDIVDLKQAKIESNWQRKGFLKKVFTEEEQTIILNANNSFKMVWKIWAMKESAYKIYLQQQNHRFFDPKKIQCKLFDKKNGSVIIHKKEFQIFSRITDNYICTIATLKKSDQIIESQFYISEKNYTNQHKEVRKRLKCKVAEQWKIPLRDLSVRKNKKGIPGLYQNNIPLDLAFSISHHGNYGAYSILN